MRENIGQLTCHELEARLKRLEVEPYRARQIFDWLYRKDCWEFSAMKNLPRALQEKLMEHFSIGRISIEEIKTSRDLTQKFLFRFKDASFVEGVLIPFKSRLTACLSTQVGCRFRCAFCASAKCGFKRSLKASEIVAQFLEMRRNADAQRVTNVVFMGVGEPLDNYDNLMKAVRILNEKQGINLGIRKITISTVGLADAIERLGQEGLELELSVSLHAPRDEMRQRLMPINKKFPLKRLMSAVKAYSALTKRKVTFEYVLLGGYNTGVKEAEGLVRLLRGINAKVNLIPYNQVSEKGEFQPPKKLEMLFFKSYLTQHGVDVTLRAPRGGDIIAACGQLRYQRMKS